MKRVRWAREIPCLLRGVGAGIAISSTLIRAEWMGPFLMLTLGFIIIATGHIIDGTVGKDTHNTKADE
jgi:hypothetical protein